MKPILKKGLCYCLILFMAFTCCGCSNYYKTDSITLAENFTENTAVLPDGIARYMVSLWGDLNWESGYMLSSYDFTFELESGVSLRYVSDKGLFQDYENDRHAYVSEEQRIYINTMIDEQLTKK